MTEQTLKIISPVDGSVYAERPIARDGEIDAAVSSARAALPEWKAVPVKERARYVLTFIDALAAMNEEVTVELAWQMGRPVRYGGEKRAAEERVRAVAAMAEEALKPYYPPEIAGFRRYIAREPLGIVMVIAPWNYPYLTAINTIVPGLLAGNAVILKHAAQTLLVGERLAEAFRRAGLPKGLFHNLVMSHEQTEKLIGSGRIDHVNFTGSVAGGRAIERATAGTFASLGLELGGKDPAELSPSRRLTGSSRLSRARFAAARHAIDEGIDRCREGFVAIERLECRNERSRRRIGKGIERPELRFVVRVDRTQQPFGLSQGIAEDEGIEGEPKLGRLGIAQPGGPKGAIHDLARGMIGRAGRVEAEMQMEDTRVAMSEVAIGGRHMAEIGAPVRAWDRQLDTRERLVGNPPQQLFLGAEMMQHRHRVDADTDPELAHGKARLAAMRQQVERRRKDRILVEPPPSAWAGGTLACRLR